MMSKKAKYAINAMVHLARKHGDGPITIRDIAEEENIPQKFLEAILLELKNAGLLSSKKGKGGGYYMIKETSEVTMADIMRLMDGPIALLPCVSYKHYERCDECKDENTCSIRRVFFEVRNKTVDMLKEASLDKVIQE
ncbi:MAG: Rrf2 family transcriptional regulator [Cyclobacteriaceae bacterium]